MAANPFKNPYSTRFEENTEKESKQSKVEKPHPNSAPAAPYVHFTLAPGEQLIQCPYEKSHRILTTKMGTHLDRCRTNHIANLQKQGLSERYINCPWDNFHIIPEAEGMYHSAQCPSRYKTKDQKEDYKRYAPKDKVLCPPELKDLEEDWGEESTHHLAHGSMDDPMAESVLYATSGSGLSKTTKAKFRDEKRLRRSQSLYGSFRQN